MVVRPAATASPGPAIVIITTPTPSGAAGPAAQTPVTTTVGLAPPAPVAPAAPTPPLVGRVSLIGESVMLGAAPVIQQVMGDVDIDATVGRQAGDAIVLLQARKAQQLLAPIVVLQIGNNGIFTDKQFDEVMTILSDSKRVVFINVKVARKWEAPNNAVIASGVKRYSNTVLIDWYAASITKPGYFWDDGIHLRPEGAAAYTELIVQATK